MGINGLYRELRSRDPIPLRKIAVESIQNTGRPLRVAIDVSIWIFQAQAAEGGESPAMRVLFYRLVRLLGLPIRAVFVFDGAEKPPKRNIETGAFAGPATNTVKKLIRLFGFIVHDAPGEAEADCALLQQHGIVDAVLSEDVDAVMFGCTKTMRDACMNGYKSSALNSVLVYDSLELQNGTKLDREGMVLVAMLSDGDYSPGGLSGFGVKIACEAAVAGYGKSLSRILPFDMMALDAWRRNLRMELHTNRSGFFKTRHPSLKIPDAFPNFTALYNYLSPMVSDMRTLDKLRKGVRSPGKIDIQKIREFTKEKFGWTNKAGMIKMVRVLSPSLLVHWLYTDNQASQTLEVVQRRGPPEAAEFRVLYSPIELVSLDLRAEIEDGMAFEEQQTELDKQKRQKGQTKRPFNPRREHIWIPAPIMKMKISHIEEEWKEKEEDKKSRQMSGMRFGAIEKYLHNPTLSRTPKRAREEEGIVTSPMDESRSLVYKSKSRIEIIDLTDIE